MEKRIGYVGWMDLTVDDATSIRDFYASVVGFTHTSIAMGDYDDYCMNSPADGETVVGICHRKAMNANIPPMWLVYFNVANLQQSLDNVLSQGGKILSGPNAYGDSSYAIIQDPAGACCTLFQHA